MIDMEKKDDARHAQVQFVLTLVDVGDPLGEGRTVWNRFKQLLKTALRRDGLKNVGLEQRLVPAKGKAG